MNVGAEWLIDVEGCSEETLRDLQVIKRVCEQVISELDLHVIGQAMWHQFPWPGGVTGLFLLTESHLACHTYPEYGVATFNLYCCRRAAGWDWQERLRDLLGASRIRVRFATRGADVIESVEPFQTGLPGETTLDREVAER
jgi:S-adenosylmethionine decarboxylase